MNVQTPKPPDYNYTGVEAVEVVAFSCLEWGIAAREINLAVNPSIIYVLLLLISLVKILAIDLVNT